MKILLANKKKSSPQIAHLPDPQAGLQFERANAQTQNCKRAIFINAK